MSWIHHILNFLFPPPVSIHAFQTLPHALPHDHEPWILAATQYRSAAQKIAKYIKTTPDMLFFKECAYRMAISLESYVIETHQFQLQHIVLVPVPQHTSRTRERGFNQSELLANQITQLLSYTTTVHALVKTRHTEKQALLPKHKRLKNQQNAFASSIAIATIPPKSLVVLIDDISTTGSTLSACKTALRERGLYNVIGLVFAH